MSGAVSSQRECISGWNGKHDYKMEPGVKCSGVYFQVCTSKKRKMCGAKIFFNKFQEKMCTTATN